MFDISSSQAYAHMTDFCCLFVCRLLLGMDDLCLLDHFINSCCTSHVHVQNSFKITILRAYLALILIYTWE